MVTKYNEGTVPVLFPNGECAQESYWSLGNLQVFIAKQHYKLDYKLFDRVIDTMGGLLTPLEASYVPYHHHSS